MSTLMDILRGVVGLFIDDEFLAIAVLVVVGVTALLIRGLGVAPLTAGVILLAGNVLVLIIGAARTARRKGRP